MRSTSFRCIGNDKGIPEIEIISEINERKRYHQLNGIGPTIADFLDLYA
jgi:hypothetical protein